MGSCPIHEAFPLDSRLGYKLDPQRLSAFPANASLEGLRIVHCSLLRPIIQTCFIVP